MVSLHHSEQFVQTMCGATGSVIEFTYVTYVVMFD